MQQSFLNISTYPVSLQTQNRLRNVKMQQNLVWLKIWMRSPRHPGWWISQVCFISTLPCHVFFLIISLLKNLGWKACSVSHDLCTSCRLGAGARDSIRFRLDFFFSFFLARTLGRELCVPLSGGTVSVLLALWCDQLLMVSDWWLIYWWLQTGDISFCYHYFIYFYVPMDRNLASSTIWLPAGTFIKERQSTCLCNPSNGFLNYPGLPMVVK